MRKLLTIFFLLQSIIGLAQLHEVLKPVDAPQQPGLSPDTRRTEIPPPMSMDQKENTGLDFDKFINTPSSDNAKYQPLQVSEEYMNNLAEQQRIQNENYKNLKDKEDLMAALPEIIFFLLLAAGVGYLIYQNKNPTETATKEIVLKKRSKDIQLREMEVALQEREAELIRKEKLQAERDSNS